MNWNKLIIFVLVGLLLMGLGGAAVYYYMSNTPDKDVIKEVEADKKEDQSSKPAVDTDDDATPESESVSTEEPASQPSADSNQKPAKDTSVDSAPAADDAAPEAAPADDSDTTEETQKACILCGGSGKKILSFYDGTKQVVHTEPCSRCGGTGIEPASP